MCENLKTEPRMQWSTPDFISKVGELHQEGKSVVEIAADMLITLTTIYNRMARMKRENPGVVFPKWNRRNRALVAKKQITQQQIASAFGV